MEANKLMLGDWVCDSRDGEQKIVQRIFKDCIDVNGNKSIPNRYIQTIPLTTEILEKNRFEYYTKFNYKHINYNLYVIHEHDCTFTFQFSRNRNYFIRYVHELQHALRLCGLSNLADNFKI